MHIYIYKHFTTAAILLTLVCISFVSQSHAFEFVEKTTDSEDINYGYSQGIWHVAYVKTSTAYYTVDWFIREPGSTEFVYQESSWGDSTDPKVEAWFWPYWLSGTIKGAKYTIKAVAYPMQHDPNGPIKITHTYTLKVYSPIIDSGIKKTTAEGADVAGILRVTGANGHAELTRHYFNGSFIGIDGFIRGYNGTEDRLTGLGRFRHALLNKPADELEQDLANDPIKSGETYGPYYTSDYGTFFEYPTGGNIVKGDDWECEAYIRLEVSDGLVTDSWLATTTSTFTYEDNP